MLVGKGKHIAKQYSEITRYVNKKIENTKCDK